MKRAFVVGMAVIALGTGAIVGAQSPRTAEVQMKAAQQKAEVEGDLQGAIEDYKKIVAGAGSNRALAAEALVRIAECHRKLGNSEAGHIYERIVRDFADQDSAVTIARQQLGTTVRRSSTLPMLTTQRVLNVGNQWDRISPDGRYIARPENGTGNLVLYELASGTVRAVTADGNPDDSDHRFPLASVFSRDGSQIAYEWYVEKDDRSVVRLVGTTDGSRRTPRTLFDNPDVDVTPADWSPDGRWLAAMIERKDRTRQIALISVADGSLRVLKTVDWSRIGGLRFSPDSLRLAYHRPPQEGVSERDVFVMTVDGSRESVVANSSADDTVLEWTPDGRRLLIASDRGGSNSVWSIAASGTPASIELVKSDIGVIASLGPTTDGTLFYNLLPALSGIYTATFDTRSGQLSPGSVQALQQFKGYGFFPQLLDDGKTLAYVSRREVGNGLGNVLTMFSMDTKTAREVHPGLSYGNFPHWFPDGRHVILYGVDLKGRPGVFKVDATTGSVVLTLPRDTCNLPFLAADGASIFCHDPARKQLRLLDASTGTVVRVLDVDQQPYAASPDGRFVATAGLQLVDLVTGAGRDLIQLSPPTTQVGNSFTINWTPDSRSVVFYGRLKGDEGMWRVPIDGGAAQKIDLPVKPILSWRFNATTGQATFSTNGNGPRLETWKMENFLPANSTKRE